MILIPEQISYLREELNKLLNKQKYDKNYMEERIREFTIDEYSRTSNINNNIYYESDENYKRIKEIYKIFSESTYLFDRTYDYISVGTKFEIAFDDSSEVEKYILVDEAFGCDNNFNCISSQSPIGKEILGKREGESFSSIINGKQIRGKILKIEKDSKKYMHFIREKDFDLRKCKEYKKRLKYLKYNMHLSSELENEYNTHLNLTASQHDILLLEKERLEKLNKKDNSTIQRLAYIDKMLKRPIVSPKDDGTIGVGSKFSILFFKDDRVEERRVELINSSVSTELDYDYIERIGGLGSKLYGLKDNDEFYIKIDNKFISGIVFDIDNKVDSYTTNSPRKYQIYCKRK